MKREKKKNKNKNSLKKKHICRWKIDNKSNTSDNCKETHNRLQY